MTPITLTQANAAQVFSQQLAQPTVTQVLIFGTDAAAQKGQQYCTDMQNSTPDEWKATQFLFVPNPDWVKSQLEALNISINNGPLNPFVWGTQDITCMSISPANNVISFLMSSQDMLNGPGDIRMAIIEAQSNG